MANNLGGYDLTFFAMEALINLRKSLGFGASVYRGIEQEPQQRGNTITISRPSNFESKPAPSSKQDINADQVDVVLDSWEEVKFGLTDKDLHASRDKIVEDHISPAVDALAESINTDLATLFIEVPWEQDVNTTAVKKNFTQPRKILRKNGAPLRDGRMNYGVSPDLEAIFLETDFVTSPDKGGELGERALRTAQFQPVLGTQPFADGTIQEHTSGTVISNANDVKGKLNGAISKGDTSLDIDGLNGSETLKKGDTFVIAGNRQRYVVTEDATLSTGSVSGLKFAPAAVQDYSDNTEVTFPDGTSTNADQFNANLMFHRNAFGLAMAPLQSEMGAEMARQQGIEVETVTDEETQLTLRARRWYDPDNSRVLVSLDALWGVKTLNRNLAVRVRGDV